MTDNLEHLKFPSRRTVAAARADAKKRARLKGIPLHHALDDIAKENGMNLTWAQAMAYLSSQAQDVSIPDDVFSCDSVTLLAIQKEAKAARKESGRSLQDELIDACRRHKFEDPILAAKTLYATVRQKEVHRVLMGPLIITLSAYGRDLYIDGMPAPNKPAYGYLLSQQVVYGDVTVIEKAKDGDTNMNGYPLNSGWWLCKYSIHEPRVDLSELTLNQVKFIANLFGFEPFMLNSEILSFEINREIDQAPIFESVRMWANAHPRLAAQGKSTYSGDWGGEALRE